MPVSQSLLREVVSDQKERFATAVRGVPREILSEVRKHYESPQSVIITGLRRAGKSTLAAQIADDLPGDSYYYLNFEDERLSGFELSDFRVLEEVFTDLYGRQKIYILDEPQVVESWEKFVRRASDSGSKFFITGSNAKLLSKEFGTKLTGRASYLDLLPFSFQEYLQAKEISLPGSRDFSTRALGANMLRQYLLEGGIPLAITYPELNILSDLYQDVIYRDVVVRYNLDSAKPIKDLSNFIFNNPCALHSYSKLKQLIQIGSVTTIKNYVDFLESAWLMFPINIYAHSTKRRQLQPKKIACIDTGLINSLATKRESKLGRIFENAVFLQLRRRYREIYYYMTQKNEEIDFYIPSANLFIQACLDLVDSETRAREFKSLQRALCEIPDSRGVIVTMEANEEIESPGKKNPDSACLSFFRGALKMSSQNLPVKFEFLGDRPEFIPIVARWYFDKWGHKRANNSFEATCERIKGMLNRDKAPLHIVAIQDNELLGAAQLQLYEMEEYPDKEYWLGGVFVSPTARNRGIACSLALKVSEIANSLGIKELYLQTGKLDGGVYTRAGWKPYEQIISKGEEVLVMVKALGV